MLPETVRTNVTLIFNAAQPYLQPQLVLRMCHHFARIDDQGTPEVVRSIAELYSKQNLDTRY